MRDAKFWLRRTVIEVEADRGEKSRKELELRTLSGGVGNVTRCLLALALLEEGGSEDLEVGSLLKAIGERRIDPLVNRGEKDDACLSAIFPVAWRHGDSTWSTVEEPDSEKVNVVTLLVENGEDKGLASVRRRAEVRLSFTISVNDKAMDLSLLKDSATVRAILEYLNMKKLADGGAIDAPVLIDDDEDVSDPSGNTSSFTGREWVIEAFDQFVSTTLASPASPKSGYFCVMGPPGIGKSAICEHVANSRQLPFVQFKDEKISFPNGTIAEAESIIDSCKIK